MKRLNCARLFRWYLADRSWCTAKEDYYVARHLCSYLEVREVRQ